MKELYIAPELKVTCFAPVERLAADVSISFDDLLSKAGPGYRPQAGVSGETDIDLNL